MQLVGWQHWAGTHSESLVQRAGSPVGDGDGVSVRDGVAVGGVTVWVHPQKRTRVPIRHRMRRNRDVSCMVQ